MGTFDIIIIGIFAISIFFGTYNGLTRFVTGVLAFFSSIWLTWHLYPLIMPFMKERIANDGAVLIATCVLAYVLSSITCGIIVSIINKLLSPVIGGVFDRSLGMAVGALRGLMIVTSIFLVLSVALSGSYSHSKTIKDLIEKVDEQKQPKWFKDAFTYNKLKFVSKGAFFLLPNKVLNTTLPQIPGNNVDSDEESK